MLHQGMAKTRSVHAIKSAAVHSLPAAVFPTPRRSIASFTRLYTHHALPFTQEARAVIQHAKEEAAREALMFASNCHLVLGLVAVESSTSGRVMSSLGITVTWAREGLQHGQDAVNSPVRRADVELEPTTRATLAAADAAASRAGAPAISTYHILAAMLLADQRDLLEMLGAAHSSKAAVLDMLEQAAQVHAEGQGSAPPGSQQQVQDLVEQYQKFVQQQGPGGLDPARFGMGQSGRSEQQAYNGGAYTPEEDDIYN